MPGNPLDYWGPDPSNPLTQGSPTWADAARWNAQNALDTWQAMKDPQTWVDAARQYGNALMMGTTAPGGGPGITAYHGSPYSFERFDTSKIGTGEGAQAYGHGLYFAENEGVARNYRNTTSDTGATVGGQPYDPSNISHVASYYVDELGGGDRSAALQRIADETSQMQAKIDNLKSMYPTVTDDAVMRGIASPYVTAKQRLGMIHDLVADNKTELAPYQPPGHLYQVNLAADPEHFLDWDKPRDQLSPKVQEWAKQNYPAAWDKAADGSSLYQHVVAQVQSEYPGATKGYLPPPGFNAHEQVTQEMAQAGIPGIRYLDQGSRGAGQGTSNYVVFSPDIINIIRRYGIAGLIGGGAAAAGSTPSRDQ